ncbi:DUF5977 domain-containing protein [Lacihabitans soyangensis]|uniref:PA14 domain-containing protein n=1 Tax=Lacihabitans soyangensis TaxID=869394 RepID=A0AAE3H6T4_9BACT|nr:PA14 domain-containing protein [Lacihabitans soyangensis]MCP9765119.1 hypothetical protein [Lacihabitans soyangensis]
MRRNALRLYFNYYMDLLIAENLAYGNLVLVKNKVEINIDAADLLIEDRSGLKYFLKLQVRPFPNASTWEDLPEMETVEEPVEDLGGALIAKGAFFEVDKILKSYVAASPPTGTPDRPKGGVSLDIRPCVDLVRPFRFVATVKNGAAVLSTYTSETMYAIRAGINEKYWKEWNSRFFGKWFAKTKGFLTWNPGCKVLPNQPVYLYFLTNMNPSPFALKLRVFRWYTDGTADTTAQTISVLNTQAMNVYEVPCGLDVIASATVGAKKVARYMVWLVNENDAVVSKMNTYEVDWSFYDDSRILIFRNSLGGYDTLACTGRITENVFVTRETTERIVPFESLASFAEVVINNVTGERELTVSTGWLDAKQRAWLEELAFSEDVYVVTDREHIPLMLMDESYNTLDSREQLIGRTFVFRYTNSESGFSDLPEMEAEAERPTGWRTYAYGGCELDGFGKRTGKRHVSHIEKYYVDDNSAVKPVSIKLNTPGETGYKLPEVHAGCAVTPFLSDEYVAFGTYSNQTCTGGLIGGPASIKIDKDRWGSEESKANANAKALLEWQAINTQAYANMWGTCLPYTPGGLAAKFYSYSVNATGVPPADVFDGTPVLNAFIGPVELSDAVLTSLGLNADYVAMRAAGFVKAPVTGDVTFYIKNDDGVRLWMGAQSANVSRVLTKRMDDWLTHGPVETSFTVSMAANEYYSFVVEYFEYNGYAALEIAWSYAGQAKVLVPLTNWYHE